MLPKTVESLWMGTTPLTSFPELKREIETDVVIIGGGIAGLNAAYFLKRQDLKVVLVEATYIAAGTSGNTTAKVTSQHELKYAYLKDSLGYEKAQIYADSNQWAIAELERIASYEKINCDFQKTPAYTYARTKKGAEEIKREVEIAKELGLPASFVVSEIAVPFKIQGAIKFENQAYFHPRKYLISIAARINGNGSYIFEKTKALDIKESGDSCSVITDKGNLKSKHVIVATNFPFYDKGGLFSQIQQIRSYVLACESGSSLPQGMFIGVGGQDISFRPHISGKKKWLIIGGVHHPAEEITDANSAYQKLEQYAREYFNVGAIDYKWAAQDCMPQDRVPYIGRFPLSKRIFVTTGYGAWGMTTSFVSARILTEQISGEESIWKDLYSPSRLEIAEGYKKHIIKEKRDDFMDLKTDEGKVVNQKGKLVALYRKKTGKINAVSAVCTHMGCTVGWNSTDKSWDCPCHGSRFDKMGKVVHGPAVEDLPKLEIGGENLIED